MEFKRFMSAVEEEVCKLETEAQLRQWIWNYARTIAEDRESFLSKFSRLDRCTHEEKLKEIIGWCHKINHGEMMLSCSGYEEYGESYWDSDWVTEYEDPHGIGEKLKEFYGEAEQCIYDGDYKTASRIYREPGALKITAEYEAYEETQELGVEEMAAEELVSLDLKRIASLTLYSTYQVTAREKRAVTLYALFSRRMFRDIKIEDMLSAGREPLEEVDDFIESWITYLRDQDDWYTSRLLIEAVKYKGGQDELLEEAKRTVNQHPALFIEILEEYYASELWEKLVTEGREALRLMKQDMKIREKAACLTAVGAKKTGDRNLVKYARTEAFCSKASAENYLKLITCEGVTREEQSEILERVKMIWKSREKQERRYKAYWRQQTDKDYYVQGDNEAVTIQFFAQNFKMVLDSCKKQKENLGWSGQYIEQGVPLLLALLYQGKKTAPAMTQIFAEIESDISYHSDEGGFVFKDAVQMWKRQVFLPENVEKNILEYLQKVIDGRVAAIVSGGHRGSYYKAARLGAALGEVEESLGVPQGKAKRVQKYLGQFPRHRAFKQEMKALMGNMG